MVGNSCNVNKKFSNLCVLAYIVSKTKEDVFRLVQARMPQLPHRTQEQRRPSKEFNPGTCDLVPFLKYALRVIN